MLERNPSAAPPTTFKSLAEPWNIVGERRDLEHELVLQVVGFCTTVPTPLREEVVRSVHAQQIADEERLHLFDEVGRRRTSALASSGSAAPFHTDRQVLGRTVERPAPPS